MAPRAARTSPSVLLYGGSIAPGHFKGHDVTIQDVFEAVGAHAAGTHRRRGARTRSRTPRRPARAPAAASSPPTRWRWPSRSSASRRWAPRWSPPRTRRRPTSPSTVGELVMDVLARGQRPRDIITREAIENAIAAVAMSGGSTNGVLHLLAIAREVGVAAHDRRLRPRSPRSTPLLCDLKPGGQLRGGRPATRPAASRSWRSGCWRPACCTRARRRSRAARSASTPEAATETEGQDVVRPPGRAAEADRRHRDPARQPRARGLRRQARRARARQARGPGARLRVRGGRDGRRDRRARSRPATSS